MMLTLRRIRSLDMIRRVSVRFRLMSLWIRLDVGLIRRWNMSPVSFRGIRLLLRLLSRE